MVGFAVRQGLDFYNGGQKLDSTIDFCRIGQILVDENHKSVNSRYKNNEEPYEYKRKIVDSVSPIQIVKACHCLNYQSCEHPDYEKSFAKIILDSIIESAIREVPEYQDAEWTID